MREQQVGIGVFVEKSKHTLMSYQGSIDVFLLCLIVDEFGKRCCHFFSVVLDGILFIFTGNDDIYKSLNEFEIWPDPTTDHRVSCP